MKPNQRWASLASMCALGAWACTPTDRAPMGSYIPESSVDASGHDAMLTDSSSFPRDGASDANGLDGSVASGDAGRDAGPPIDAALAEGGKPGTPSSACAVGPLAWWATNAALDPNVVATAAVTQLNPLLALQHPITIVERQDANDPNAWTLLTTASKENGIGDQYFPFDHTTSPVSDVRTSTTLASSVPEATAYLRLIDSKQLELWIPLVNLSTTATYADFDCTTLKNGSVAAVIPSTAASTALTTAAGPTTLGTLFGSQTSAAPAGWTVKMAFSAQKVQVSFK